MLFIYLFSADISYYVRQFTSDYIMQRTFIAFHTKLYIMPKKRIIMKIANRGGSNKVYQIRLVYKTAAYKIKRMSTDLSSSGKQLPNKGIKKQ
jgi:hypothetical protein